jgi:hypothetical protein
MYFVSQIGLSSFGQTFTSSNLPIVVINANGQAIDPYMSYYVNMGIIDNGPGVRNNITDPYNSFNGLIEIELHGQSTLNLPKKSYGISAVDAAHKDIAVSLFGFPAGKDWVFKGLYQDKTLIRDELGFRIHNQMGHYSSRTRFFELVIDGDYKGVYQIEEKVKRDDGRVNISKLKYTDTTGDQLTGGYIIRLDKYWTGDQGWYSNYMSNATHDAANYYLYYYPKQDSIQPQQKAYISNYFHAFENAIVNVPLNDAVNGYRKYIDVNSFLDEFILTEFSKNTDGYRSSTYFYKERDSKGGKLFCGPKWDFNIAFDNCNFNGGDSPYGWQYQVYAQDNFVPFWWWYLLSDTYFKDQLKCRYQYLRTNVLSLNNLYQHIDSMAAFLNEAQIRNFQKWPIMGTYVEPNSSPIPADYAGEIGNIKDFITQRLNWMDANIPGFCQVGINEKDMAENFIKAYPNPFSNTFTISYTLTENSDVKIQLMNVMGANVKEVTDSKKAPGEYKEEISANELSNGIYIVRMNVNGKVYHRKVNKTLD